MAQPMNSNGLPHPGGHRKKRMAPKSLKSTGFDKKF